LASTKEIKRRIKSVTSTKQIISAMELVSVVKMQKAVAKDLASRNFTTLGTEVLSEVCSGIDLAMSPLLEKREGKRKLVIAITSDRGLCGALNARIIKQAIAETEDFETDFIAIGRKCRDFLTTHQFHVIASYTSFGDDLEFSKIIPIIHQVADDYLAGKYDIVRVVYTHFESSLTQVPTAATLLPFELDSECEPADNIIFDPSKDEIITALVPRILEAQAWQYILESAASEHSARMVAMKNANENAEDLIFDLTLSFNQTRQAGITREIAEISAGKMTLEE